MVIEKMITENEIQWVYTQCKIRYGVHIQMLVLAEEAAELAKASLRYCQPRGEPEHQLLFNVLEELADVKNLKEQLKVFFPKVNIDHEIERIRLAKLARLRDRLIKSGSPFPF